MANYQIPLGIDAEGVLNPMNTVIETIERASTVATEASREISAGFSNGGRSVAEFERRLEPVTTGLSEIVGVSRRAQDGLTNTFSERTVNTNAILTKVNDFKAKLQSIEINKRIGVELEEGAVQELEIAVRQMQQSFPSIQAELNQQVSFFNNAVDQSRSNVEQLQADIARMEAGLAGQAPSEARAGQEMDLGSARQALAEEQALLQQNSSSLGEYQTASRELVGNIQGANRAVADLSQAGIGISSTFEQVYGTLQPLSTRLGELEDRMYELALAGQRDTEEFRELQAEAIRMRQTIQEVDAGVDTMAKRSGRLEAYVSVATGMVGAFTAAQGAVALFAGENEEMNEVLTRVMSAMAILQGIQATMEIFNKENAASILFTSTARTNEAQSTALQSAASNQHTVSLNAETAAQIAATAAAAAETAASQAQAVADAAGTVATANDTAATAADTAATLANTAAQIAETEATVVNTGATVAETTATTALAASENAAAAGAVTNTAAQGAQTIAMTASTVAATVLGFALKAIGIGLIITAVAALVEYWDELTDAMKELLPAGVSVGKMFDTVKSYAFGVGNAILQFVIAPIEALYQLLKTGDVKGAISTYMKGLDFAGNYANAKRTQDARNADKYRNEQEQKDIDALKRNLERRKNRGEDVYKQEQALLRRQMELNKKTRTDNEETQKALEDAQDKRYSEDAKKAEAARKKAEADAKAAAQKAKQEAEKAAAEKKRNDELVAKYSNEIRKLSLADTEDLLVRERDAIYLDMQNRLADLKRDNAATAEAKKKQKELEETIEWEAKVRIRELEERHNKELAAIKLDGIKQMNDLRKEDRKSELDGLEIEAEQSIAAIRERFADDYILREYLVEKTRQQLAEKQKELNLKYDQQEIDDSLQKAQILLELNKQNGELSEKQEAQHQLAILELQKQGAQAQVDLLLKNGKSESDLEVLQARLRVREVNDAIAEEAKKGKKFDMFEYLGIGKGWTGEQKQMVIDGATEMLDNMSQIADGLVYQYQRQIDKKQEVIDQFTSEIDELEGQLEKEKDLRDRGLANNVEVLEQEIAAKKIQREEEIRQQQEMQKKQQAIQKAQMIADTAFQLVGLITSSVNIIKGFSTIPIIGLPLGIAAVAAMFGAFSFAKVKAFQAVGQSTKMAKGGWIDGELHSNGGKKYTAESGAVTELERDEFVVNRLDALKSKKLLEAINSGSLNDISFDKLATLGLFETMGVSFDTDDVYRSVKDSQYLNKALNGVSADSSKSFDFSSMNDNIAYLAKKKKEEVEVWEDAQYFYRKKGTRTTKTPKKD